METPEKSPTSADAATEQHASAERNNEDLSTTKALTQGTEDVNNGNVRRIQDPRMSSEDSAKGTSAKCAETTTVILESAPHEMQNRLQNSLPLTPRLPIEGEPSGCKQEAADSVVTAGRTNRMVRMVEPTEIADVNLEKAAPDGELAERAHRIDEGDETDADVDRTALLGGEPAEMACRVDKGDGTEHGYQARLQQTGFYCEESRQRNENTNTNVPIAYGLPLKGEWTVCVSGKASNLEGDADALNEPTELLMTKVEPSIENGGGVPRVCLGGTQMRTGHANGPVNQLYGSRVLADGSGAQPDAPSVLNDTETVCVSHSNGAGTYLSAGDAKRGVTETNGVETHADVSIGHGDAQSIKMDTDISANNANHQITLKESETARLTKSKRKNASR